MRRGARDGHRAGAEERLERYGGIVAIALGALVDDAAYGRHVARFVRAFG